jgi:hypothetical protein
MPDDTVKPFVIAMTFGAPPNEKVVVAAELAVNQAAAVAIAVSKAHVDNGVTDRLKSLAVAEMTPEFIEAAHRGSAAPAPVLSIVPQDRIPRWPLDSAYAPPSQHQFRVCPRCGGANQHAIWCQAAGGSQGPLGDGAA